MDFYMLDPYNNDDDRAKYVDSVVTFFKREGLVVVTAQGDHSLSSFYALNIEEDSYYKHLTDRSFYPDGQRGDEMYKTAMDSFLPDDVIYPEYSFAFFPQNDSTVSLELSNFKKGISEAEVVSSYNPKEDAPQKKSIVVRIDGENLSASHYIVPVEYMTFIDGPDSPVSTETSETSETVFIHLVVFEYQGSQFALVLYGLDENASLASYTTLQSHDINNAQDEQVVRTLFETMFEDVNQGIDNGA